MSRSEAEIPSPVVTLRAAGSVAKPNATPWNGGRPARRILEQRGASNAMILVLLFDLKFLTEFPAGGVGTSNRRHLDHLDHIDRPRLDIAAHASVEARVARGEDL